MNNMDESDYKNSDIEHSASDTYGTCDICGAPLDPEDRAIHLCKFCQSMQFEDEQDYQ